MKIYVASRASLPERAAMWRRLREQGCPIVSTWIDEDGPDQTVNFSELWRRISAEIRSSELLLCYAETNDFPLKGALVEVGIALGCGVPVALVIPGVQVQGRTFRPVGSWMMHPDVSTFTSLATALAFAGWTLLWDEL